MNFHKAFDCVANLVLWTLILVFLAPVFGLLFLWKLTVVLVAKFYDGSLHPTDPNDTYFAIDDTSGIPIVNAAQIWKIKGHVDLDQFREHFHTCFFTEDDSKIRYRNFYCYLVKFGGYVFKKSVSKIDLRKQIVERDLPPGSNLEEWITKWFIKEKFPEEMPLWQIVLLRVQPGTCSEEECETVFLYKNHHCLADGYGFCHIADKLTGNTSPYLVKEEPDSLISKIKDAFCFPYALTKYVLDVSRTEDMFYPIKNPGGRQWFLGLSSMDLKPLKEIRRQTNTHFITVMKTLMIGALRRFLIEKRNEKDIPPHIYTANSLPWPNHPQKRFVNHWSGGVFKIPFGTSDPLERLQGADQFFKHFHDTHMNRMVKRIIIPVTWTVPSCLLRLGHSMDLYYFRYSNTIASLMLSEEEHFLLGKKVENIYLPLALTDNVPTCVFFGVSASHSGKIDISIVANSEIVSSQSDIDLITKTYFPLEVENLRKRLNEANNNFVVQLE